MLILSVADKSKADEVSDEGKSSLEETSDVMPTGRVVGILQRNWKEYVACFSQDEVNNYVVCSKNNVCSLLSYPKQAIHA